MRVVCEVSIDMDERRQIRVETSCNVENIGDLAGASAALTQATQRAALDAYGDAVQRRMVNAGVAEERGPDMRSFGDED